MRSVEEIMKKHHKICWYPSAGADFRVLLFLSEQYYKLRNINIASEELPDLFILSDCCPNNMFCNGYTEIEILNKSKPYIIKNFLAYNNDNEKTKIVASDVEVLDRLDVPYDERLFDLGKSDNFGYSFFFKAHISSEQLGEWDANVIYLLTENTGFALRYLLPRGLSVDYITRVRYGDNYGGSKLSGDWLLKLIPHLNVRYYLSNEVTGSSFEYIPEELDESYAYLKNIWECTEPVNMEEFHCVDGIMWSDQGDIHWYRIKKEGD